MIQYNHKRKFNIKPYMNGYEEELSPRGGETIALELPQEWLVDELKVGETFTKLLGKARCSNSENYNKKTGRELTKSRMKLTVFTVVSNNLYTEKRILVIRDNNNNSYTLEKSTADNAKVRFVDYE